MTPAAWEERDHEGYKYYVHKITGQSEWAHATDHHDAFDQDAWDEEEHDGETRDPRRVHAHLELDRAAAVHGAM